MENQRTLERHPIDPPIDALLGANAVQIGDLSSIGARLRHPQKLQPGLRAQLHLEGGVSCETELVWCHPSVSTVAFESGVRILNDSNKVEALLDKLVREGRTSRVEDLRGSARYGVTGGVHGHFGDVQVRIVDISSKGTRVETAARLDPGTEARLRFVPEGSDLSIEVNSVVVWRRLSAVWGKDNYRYDAGIFVKEMHGMMRAAIGLLAEMDRCSKDTTSLLLKSRFARFELPEPKPGLDQESGGRLTLIRCIRDMLRSNPVEKSRWMERSKTAMGHPMIKGVAGPIAEDAEALAVWEFVERSIDPSIVAAAMAD
ncbi:MAG: PilZ domain-containing protein [Acidobacteria bacterium]|nr:PilZ domain-containing protein [Acidobacteriota bacterium]